MKRFAICTVLFPLLLALGALCMSELTHVKKDVLSSVDELYQAVESGDTAQAGELAEEFQQHWENTEHHIMAFGPTWRTGRDHHVGGEASRSHRI